MNFLQKAVIVVIFSTVIIPSISSQTQDYFPDPDPAINTRLEEWKDLKFGLLMHWGPYSQWGIVESWSICPEDVGWATGARKKEYGDNYFDYLKKYESLPKTFNPTKFNPERWAKAAKDAGMRYMVFTTKHHDGFCMFDTKYTDYKITGKTTFFSKNARANVTKEIFNAFRKENMWVGAYFSKPDWHSDYYWWKKFPPADRNANYSIDKYPEQWKKFTDFTHNQIDELVSNYGKVDILWLDGGWVRKKTEDEVKENLLEIYDGVRYARNPQNQDINMDGLVKEVRAKQPNILVVDRAVPGKNQNYLTPEQHIPESGLPYPWETCMTMGNSWSYVPNDIYKPANEIIEKLVDIVSKGGNYLLNIGPGPDGEFDPVAYTRLAEIGKWMKQNGEAIYNTRMYSHFGQGDHIRFTQSKDGKTKFIFLFEFPMEKMIIENMVLPANATIQMLGDNAHLQGKQMGENVELILPESLKSTSPYVWVLRVK